MNTPSVHPTIPARYPGDLEKGTPVAPTDPERFRQLIILIPADADCASFTRRISRLAIETNSCVHLLGLYRDEEQELALRREMAVTSALIRDARVYVESTIERGTDWVAAVRRIHQGRGHDRVPHRTVDRSPAETLVLYSPPVK